MKKIYSVFEKIFGRFYHPLVKMYRFNAYKFSDASIFLKMNFLQKIPFNSNKNGKKRIFYDVTFVSKGQRFAGISRVVLKIKEILPQIQKDYEIVEVFAKQFTGYYELATGRQIVPSENDIFFCAEATEGIVNTNGKYFSLLRNKGVRTFFFLHDLIPIKFPQYMGSKNFVGFYKKYLSELALSSGVICNSKSVLNDFEGYLEEKKIKKNPLLKTSYSHLGVDFKSVGDFSPEKNSVPVFLMVSTVEARKKYDQAVKAFDILWKKGFDLRLNIVGKYGWRAEEAKELIENNSEFNKRLFWYNSGISDDELCTLYKNCDCVVFASMAEGFGLSLVEASFYKKPLIIRDIPIFREVAGNNAYYFESEKPEVLAVTIQEWLTLYKENRAPSSEGIKYISWEEYVSNIFTFISF